MSGTVYAEGSRQEAHALGGLCVRYDDNKTHHKSIVNNCTNNIACCVILLRTLYTGLQKYSSGSHSFSPLLVRCVLCAWKSCAF
jgi:hypothetical protein